MMPIGQAGEWDNLRDSTRIERDSLMRTHSTDPIMASGLVPRVQAGHMNVPDPTVTTSANPLAQRGPSTHESQLTARGNPLSRFLQLGYRSKTIWQRLIGLYGTLLIRLGARELGYLSRRPRCGTATARVARSGQLRRPRRAFCRGTRRSSWSVRQ